MTNVYFEILTSTGNDFLFQDINFLVDNNDQAKVNKGIVDEESTRFEQLHLQHFTVINWNSSSNSVAEGLNYFKANFAL